MAEAAAQPVKRRHLPSPRVYASKGAAATNNGPLPKARPRTWISQNPSSTNWSSQIGARVCIGGAKTGILLFYGHTDFADGVFCGVKLDERVGKNDGSVQGHRYFTCPPGYGIFAPPQKVVFINDKSEISPAAEECTFPIAHSTPDLVPEFHGGKEVLHSTFALEDCGEGTPKRFSLSSIRPVRSKTKPEARVLNQTLVLDTPVFTPVLNGTFSKSDGEAAVLFDPDGLSSDIPLATVFKGSGEPSESTQLQDLVNGGAPNSGCRSIQKHMEEEEEVEGCSEPDEVIGGQQWSVELHKNLEILSPGHTRDIVAPTGKSGCYSIQEQLEEEGCSGPDEATGGRQWSVEQDESLGILSPDQMRDFTVQTDTLPLAQTPSDEGIQEIVDDEVVDYVDDEAFQDLDSTTLQDRKGWAPELEENWKGFYMPYQMNRFIEKESFPSAGIGSSDKRAGAEAEAPGKANISETRSEDAAPIMNLEKLKSGFPDMFAEPKSSLEVDIKDQKFDQLAPEQGVFEATFCVPKCLGASEQVAEEQKAVKVEQLSLKAENSSSVEISPNPKQFFTLPALKHEPKIALVSETRSAIAAVELQLKRQESPSRLEEAVPQMSSYGAVEYLMQQMGGNFVQQVTEGGSTMAVSVTSIDTGYQGDAECDLQSDAGTNAANTPIEDSGKEFGAETVGKQPKGDPGSDSDFCSDMAASWTESDLELDDRARGRGARIIDGRLYFSGAGREAAMSTESLPEDATGRKTGAELVSTPEKKQGPDKGSQPVVVVTPDSPASDDTLRGRDSVISGDSASGGEMSLRGDAILEEAEEAESAVQADVGEVRESSRKVEKACPVVEAPPPAKRPATPKTKTKTKGVTPLKKETPPKSKRGADGNKETPKTPKKNVMSKIKAMIEGASSKLTSSKDSGSPNSSADKEEAKKPGRQPKKSRWDAVMSKIAAGQAEEKTKTKKEVASRVYSNLTPSRPSTSTARSPRPNRNAIAGKKEPPASATRPPKQSARPEAASTASSKTRLKSMGTSSEATDFSINSHSERSTSQLLSRKSKIRAPGTHSSGIPVVKTNASLRSCSPQPSLASTGSRGSTLSQLTLASHSSARPIKDHSTVSMGSNKSAPTDKSRGGKTVPSVGRRSPMPPPIAPPPKVRRIVTLSPARGSRTTQHGSEGSRKVTGQTALFHGQQTAQTSGAQPSSRGHGKAERASKKSNPSRWTKDQSAQLRSLKTSSGLVKSGPHPDLLHSSVTRAGPAREVSRLEALCEARTKELNFVRMQLKHCAAGFDSLAVLVQYLTHDVGAFSVPELTSQLQLMQEKLQATREQLEGAKEEQLSLLEEIANLHRSHQLELVTNEEEARQRLAEARQLEEETHQKAILTLQEDHKEITRKLELTHVEQLSSLKELYKEQEKLEEDGHQEEIAKLEQKHLLKQSDLAKAHAEQVAALSSKHAEVEAALEDKIQELTAQYEELENQHKSMQETWLNASADHRLQAYANRCTSLGKEADSLKAVLEMRQAELQDLRREKQEAERQAEELALAREEIKKLNAKTEDLQAQMIAKNKLEKALLLENETLKENCDKAAELSKRVTMENESLHWRLRQSKEFSLTMNPLEASGEHPTNGANGGGISYYWDNEGLGTSFSPIKAGCRPASYPKGSPPHCSPRLSPSKMRQPHSAPSRPVSAPVYAKDTSAPPRMQRLSTSEDESLPEWESEVNIKLEKRPRRRAPRSPGTNIASEMRNGHRNRQMCTSTPNEGGSLEMLRNEVDSSGVPWDKCDSSIDSRVDEEVLSSCFGDEENPALEAMEENASSMSGIESLPDCCGGNANHANQVNSNPNIELDLISVKVEGGTMGRSLAGTVESGERTVAVGTEMRLCTPELVRDLEVVESGGVCGSPVLQDSAAVASGRDTANVCMAEVGNSDAAAEGDAASATECGAASVVAEGSAALMATEGSAAAESGAALAANESCAASAVNEGVVEPSVSESHNVSMIDLQNEESAGAACNVTLECNDVDSLLEKDAVLVAAETESGAALGVTETENSVTLAVSEAECCATLAVAETEGGAAVAMTEIESGAALPVTKTESGAALADPKTECGAALLVTETESGAMLAMTESESGAAFTAFAVTEIESDEALAATETESGAALSATIAASSALSELAKDMAACKYEADQLATEHDLHYLEQKTFGTNSDTLDIGMPHNDTEAQPSFESQEDVEAFVAQNGVDGMLSPCIEIFDEDDLGLGTYVEEILVGDGATEVLSDSEEALAGDVHENGDEDASRTSSSELVDSVSLESSLGAAAAEGSPTKTCLSVNAQMGGGAAPYNCSCGPSPKKTTTLVITFRANRQSISSSRSSSPMQHPGTPSASEGSESQSAESSPRASPISQERLTNKAIELLENSLFGSIHSPRTSAGESMILDELSATPPPQDADPTHVLLKKVLQDQLLFDNAGSSGSSFRGSLDDSPLPGLSKPDTPESTSQAVVPTDSTNIDMSWSDDDLPSETEV